MLNIPGPGPGVTGSGGGPAGGIGHLLDCRMRVWRKSESLGLHREVRREYGPSSLYDVPCTMRRKATALALNQGGLVEVGGRTVYLDVGPELSEGDVCEVYAGPHAPARLEVESVAKPRGHHLELGVTEFHGKLPGDEDGGS